MKFQLFQDRSNSEFSFILLNSEGKNLLQSSQSFADRDQAAAAMTSVIESLREAGRIQTEKLQVRILDEAGNPLMESIPFENEETLSQELSAIQEEANNVTNFDVELINRRPVTSGSSFAIVDYAALYDFSQTSKSNVQGFDPFQYEQDEQFYFLFNGPEGNPILFSRAFPSIGKRDARIRQIIKSASNVKRFEQRQQESGAHYFIVKATNGSEIARSKDYLEQADMEAAMAYLMAEAPGFAAQYPAPVKKKRKIDKDYEFEHSSTTGEQGFEKYRSDQNRLYYFHFNDESGKPILFSEGYSSSRSRDNGIKSVIKNSRSADQYEVREVNGQYFLRLKAGNRQEIGRSQTYPDRITVEGIVGKLIALIPIYAEQFNVTFASDVENENFALNVGRRAPEPKVQDVKTKDDYDLSYLSTSGEPGFEAFYNEKHEGHFFHFNDKEGKALFFSEGYTSDKSRDNGIKSVIKNSFLDERFVELEEENQHYFTLKAGNHQEIGRSRLFASKEEMAGEMLWFKQNAHTYGPKYGVTDLAVPAAYTASLASASTSVWDNNDYDLNHPSTSGEKGFETFFNEKHGGYYFHFNDDNGKAVFYSEGYTSEKSRDNGLQSVIKNSFIDKHFVEQEDRGQHYFTLKAGNHQEIGRSKNYESAEARDSAMLWFKQNVHTFGSKFGLNDLAVPAMYLAAGSLLGGSSSEEDSTEDSDSTNVTPTPILAGGLSGMDISETGNDDSEITDNSSSSTETDHESVTSDDDASSDLVAPIIAGGMGSVVANSDVSDTPSSEVSDTSSDIATPVETSPETNDDPVVAEEDSNSSVDIMTPVVVSGQGGDSSITETEDEHDASDDPQKSDSSADVVAPVVAGAVGGAVVANAQTNSGSATSSDPSSKSATSGSASGGAASASVGRDDGGSLFGKWWFWLLIIALLLLLLWLLLPDGCSRNNAVVGGDEIENNNGTTDGSQSSLAGMDSSQASVLRDSSSEVLDGSELEEGDEDNLEAEFEGDETEGNYEETGAETDPDPASENTTNVPPVVDNGPIRGNDVVEEKAGDVLSSNLLGPNAAALGIPAGTFAARIADYLADPNSNYPSSTFTLDRPFSYDKHYLKEPSRSQIKRYLPKVLAAYPDVNVEITGYAHSSELDQVPDTYDDPTGTKGLTISLPLLRARCIYRKLRDSRAGISTSRMKMKTQIDSQSAANDWRSRRIDLVFTK